jgi:hypothetical protein
LTNGTLTLTSGNIVLTSGDVQVSKVTNPTSGANLDVEASGTLELKSGAALTIAPNGATTGYAPYLNSPYTNIVLSYTSPATPTGSVAANTLRFKFVATLGTDGQASITSQGVTITLPAGVNLWSSPTHFAETHVQFTDTTNDYTNMIGQAGTTNNSLFVYRQYVGSEALKGDMFVYVTLHPLT